MITYFGGHNGGISSVTFNSDNSKIISGSWDKTVKIWDVKTGQCINTLVGHKNGAYSVAHNYLI